MGAVDGVKARIWKDRETGLWCYDIDDGPVSDTPRWEDALAEVLTAQSSHILSRPARM